MSVADNAVIDETGVIQPRRGFSEFGDQLPAQGDRVDQLLEYKGRVFRHDDSRLEYDTNGMGSFSTFNSSLSSPELGRRINSVETQGNFYITSSEGIKKITASSVDDINQDSLVNSGGVKATDADSTLVPTVGGFLAPQSKCAYRVLWGTRDLNNNVILGAPSSRSILENPSEDVRVTESFEINFASTSEANVEGTYILLSSNSTNYFLWWSNNANDEAPVSDDTLGRTAIEVSVEGFGSSTISIINATLNALVATGAFAVTPESDSLLVRLVEQGVNVTDPSVPSSGGPTNVTITNIIDGSTIEGSFANAEITIQIPQEITTDYFYQVYRTAPITAGVISFADLEPGDEMNLIFEMAVTQAEITAGEVVVNDTVPESFRASGAFLYTNPNTGQGILQANERPPIAKDIELFRNTLFFANTKTVHRRTIDLISVLDFTSGTSDFIIGNSSVTRTYTFRGTAQTVDLEADTAANTDGNSYFLINSANNRRRYYVWFAKGSETDPNIAGRMGIRVNINDVTTADEVATALNNAINLLIDFNSTVSGNTVSITYADNGPSDLVDITNLTGSWAKNNEVVGTGEDASTNHVLLSGSLSIAQSIDETARSLVKVINRDSQSPVQAFYISNTDSLPGQILLENKSLADNPFFLATSDDNIDDNFNPMLVVTETLTAIASGNPTTITAAGHGLSTGDEVYIYSTDSTPVIVGAYKVTVVSTDTFTIPFATTVDGTTGIWFRTDTRSDNEVRPNRLYFSKLNQPEAVPLLNFIEVGAGDKAIDRIVALRDSLFCLKEDGVYIITGTTSPNWGSRLLDSSVRITAPDSADVLNNQIMFLSTEGVVAATESGVQVISRPIEDSILAATSRGFNFKFTSFGVSYDSDRAYFIWLPTQRTDAVATQAFRYNTFTQTWTRWTNPATCAMVSASSDLLYLGAGDRPYVNQERKDRTRTDYSDRSLEKDLILALNPTQIRLSNIADLAVGDAIVQDQGVSLARFRLLARRLDNDKGLNDTDYNTLIPDLFTDISTALNALNAKLVADDSSGTVTTKTFDRVAANQLTQFNLLISELNNEACDTVINDYTSYTDVVRYETLITDIDFINFTITVSIAVPLFSQVVTIFKGIPFEIEYQPIHFGDQSLLKQVREGTIMFDQNNFYGASVSYASDLSQNFEEIPFLGRGSGDWGYGLWGGFNWGGEGAEIPFRTYVPRSKQRCRFMRVKFNHINSREEIKIVGLSLQARPISTRAYR